MRIYLCCTVAERMKCYVHTTQVSNIGVKHFNYHSKMQTICFTPPTQCPTLPLPTPPPRPQDETMDESV